MRQLLDQSEQRGVRQQWLHTFTFMTGEPNEFLREIHTRMPVILPEEHYEPWLSGEAGKEVLGPIPGRPNESMADQFSCK